MCHLEQCVQPWQRPRLDPGCWTVAMSLSQEVGPARATPSLPLCPDLRSWGARPPSGTQRPPHVPTGGLDTHLPFCSAGSGVRDRPQRVGFGPRQEEIFPKRREEWGWVKGRPFPRRWLNLCLPGSDQLALPTEHAPVRNDGGGS